MLPWTNRRFSGTKRVAHAARKAGEMNKTEAAYAARLECLRLAGEVAAWWFEPVTLVLSHGNACKYTPDFLVQRTDGVLELHEVKGSKKDGGRIVPVVEEDSMVKVKAAAELYPFVFRMVWPTDRAMKAWESRSFTKESATEK